MQKSAFIAIVGRPNVGKSSILNAMIGQKVAIVSNKPQTTRTRIMGVLTEGDDQLVFIDTPGMHKPKTSLGKYMVRSVNESVSGVDACLLVTEADREPTQTELMLIEKFKSLDLPAILAINKIDTLKNKEVLMAQILKYSKLYDFAAIVPVSAHDGDGINELKEALKEFAMEGGHFFEEDALTDQSERNLAAEMIREKILRLTDREIPHGTAVVVEKMRTRDDGSDIMDVDATIYCEKDSHKGIIIGKGGSMLKKISSQARQDMENFFDCRVNLQTWVKVKEDWRNREGLLKSFGFDKSDFD
ncbi:GTPase Era [Anaeromassilibacillus sp. An172]|uniref:GTPase Era n=1 Tax=Anaeromassilibacillus sp. An172 TaxID=1965570 RepID=UPI000B3910B2|nr:GTPase Era [Anaeromassilibacillus sp. An172]OUP79714.1 GTPase Era [Anaeromassilibacillus sp. An172]